MHTIIYLTGPQACGKSTLISALRTASEIEFCSLPPLNTKNVEKLERDIDDASSYFETVAVTENVFNNRMELFLRTLAEKNKKRFHSIQMKK